MHLRNAAATSVAEKLQQLVQHSGAMLVPASIFWAQQLLSYVALEHISGMMCADARAALPGCHATRRGLVLRVCSAKRAVGGGRGAPRCLVQV